MCHLKTNKQTEVKHDDCQHNLALIYTDLTSSIVFILDAHGGKALIAVSRLQLHPIHLLINYTVKSWHWKTREKNHESFPHTDVKQHKRNQHTYHMGVIYHGTLLLVPAAPGSTLKTDNTECVRHGVILWSSNYEFTRCSERPKFYLHPEKEQ